LNILPLWESCLTYHGVKVVESAGTVVHISILNPIFVTAVIVNKGKNSSHKVNIILLIIINIRQRKKIHMIKKYKICNQVLK